MFHCKCDMSPNYMYSTKFLGLIIDNSLSWKEWVLSGCQKCSMTPRKKFECPALKKCWQDTTLIHIFWRSCSLWMRHGSPCSIPKQKGSQNNGNIQTRHPRKNSELARLQRKFSIQFSETRRALFSHILSQRAWPSPENVTETFWRISCCLQLQKSNLNWWGTSFSIKTTLHHTRLELSQNSWWNRESRHFDILPIHLTLLQAISGCLTPWNSLYEEDNFLRDQV